MPLGVPLAMPLGGGPSPWQEELQALLDAYAPGWDASEDSESTAEVHALALGVAMIWAVNKRRQGQRIPARMLETLPRWEKACALRPLPGASPQERRAAVAARFLGFAGNTISQLYDVCAAMAGAAFLGFAVVASPTSYAPGLNPGPPGAEWASDRATIAVQLARTGLPDAAFVDLIRRLRNELNTLCPSWMTFVIGTIEGGFVPGMGIPGCTLI